MKCSAIEQTFCHKLHTSADVYDFVNARTKVAFYAEVLLASHRILEERTHDKTLQVTVSENYYPFIFCCVFFFFAPCKGIQDCPAFQPGMQKCRNAEIA